MAELVKSKLIFNLTVEFQLTFVIFFLDFFHFYAQTFTQLLIENSMPFTGNHLNLFYTLQVYYKSFHAEIFNDKIPLERELFPGNMVRIPNSISCFWFPLSMELTTVTTCMEWSPSYDLTIL